MLGLFSQTFPAKPKTQFSKFILSHNMFRSSDPDHMLIKTEIFPLISTLFRKWKSIRNNNQTSKKVNLLPNILKKLLPLRGKIPLLRRPELLLAEEFSSSLDPVTPAIWLAPFCPAVSWFFGFCWPTQSSQERIPTRAGHAVADFVGTAFFNSDLTNLVYVGTNWF